ncbi:MAG: ABC-ATPase domain-containing protein [Desulfohalobiaceae bacterium]
MRQSDDLRSTLKRIDGKGYKAYKDIQGDYDLGGFVLHIDNVQSDPYAPPSKMRVSLPQSRAGFPEEMFSNRVRRVALEDYLTRCFLRACSRSQQRDVGIDRPGQEILERTTMRVDADRVEARITVGLPAKGRSILGRKAEQILLRDLPEMVDSSLILQNLQRERLWEHIRICEDQEVLRRELADKGLVAFVGNDAILPRKSGVSDEPMPRSKAIPFVAPPEQEVSVELPHSGTVTGMGVSQGVTLVVGGGYHGKSTLLKALERSVYNHVSGDGREYVVCDQSAVKIRAEDGRCVTHVNIEPFISDLPFGEDTSRFASDNASGSTSQAANIMEALEAESRLLLLDEDTSATNFMIRDGRMQHLVAKEDEPITPFIDRVRELSSEMGISTILVLGGSGDYFELADTVLMLKEYRPFDVTARARELAQMYATQRRTEIKEPLEGVTPRVPLRKSFQLGERDKIKTKGLTTVLVGRATIDLSQVEQLVDESQTRSIAAMFKKLGEESANGEMSLSERVDALLESIREQGLDVLSGFRGKHPGYMALPRKQELCAAVNRYRKLQVWQRD